VLPLLRCRFSVARLVPTDRHGKEVKKVMLAGLYQRLRNLLNGEEGQAMVEYALILVLIAVVVLVVLMLLGNQVKNTFCNISGGLGM
jgi:pilus assembly protein Flp/PilA